MRLLTVVTAFWVTAPCLQWCCENKELGTSVENAAVFGAAYMYTSDLSISIALDQGRDVHHADLPGRWVSRATAHQSIVNQDAPSLIRAGGACDVALEGQ